MKIFQKQSQGFSLIEIIVVVIVIGVLSAFAIPQYKIIKERTLDKEAINYLNVLQAAERSYHVRRDHYYPSAGSETNHIAINENLQVNLPISEEGKPLLWVFEVFDTGKVQATRSRDGTLGREWVLDVDAAGNMDSRGTCTATGVDPCVEHTW